MYDLDIIRNRFINLQAYPVRRTGHSQICLAIEVLAELNSSYSVKCSKREFLFR